MAAPSKKTQLLNFMTKRNYCEKEAHAIVVHLIEKGIEKEYLLEKAKKISGYHLNDVAEERKLTGTCGWAICDNTLGNICKQQYIIRGKKILDITERKNFCSSTCYTAWAHFKSQMMTSPLWLRDAEPTPTFTIYEPDSETDVLHGILVKLQDVSLDDDDDVTTKKESDDDD